MSSALVAAGLAGMGGRPLSCTLLTSCADVLRETGGVASCDIDGYFSKQGLFIVRFRHADNAA